jgi:hypothetical protein
MLKPVDCCAATFLLVLTGLIFSLRGWPPRDVGFCAQTGDAKPALTTSATHIALRTIGLLSFCGLPGRYPGFIEKGGEE